MSNLAKNLRKNSTDAERKLWKHLRTKQMDGLKFRRQEPIGRYIADFVCFERKLIIEIDGGQHSESVSITNDEERSRWLESQGFAVMRFWNNEVLTNIEGVLSVIMDACRQSGVPSSPSPNPSHQGRGN